MQTAPKLPDLDNVSAFHLDALELGSNIPLTARPQDTPEGKIHIPDQIASRAGLKLCLDEIASNQDRLKSAQPTPLVMGGIVVEDPFSDAAAIQREVNPFDDSTALLQPTSPTISELFINSQSNDSICGGAGMSTPNVELSQQDHENIDSGTLTTADTGGAHKHMPKVALADTSNKDYSKPLVDAAKALEVSHTVSASSPSKDMHKFKYRTSTDEFEDTKSAANVEFSWHTRNAVENSRESQSEHRLADGDQVDDSSTRASAGSVPRTPTQQDFQVCQAQNMSTGTAARRAWTPFRDARFVILAAEMLERFPDDFKKLLMEEGLSLHVWDLLDLEASSGPPSETPPMGHFVLESFCEALRQASSALTDGPHPNLTIRQSLIRNKLRRGQRLALFDCRREMEYETYKGLGDEVKDAKLSYDTLEMLDSKDASKANIYVPSDSTSAGFVRDRATTVPSPVSRGPWSADRRKSMPSRSSEACAEICDGHHYFDHFGSQRDVSGAHCKAKHNERRLFTGTDSTLD